MLNYSFNKKKKKKTAKKQTGSSAVIVPSQPLNTCVMLFCVTVGKYINIDVYIYIVFLYDMICWGMQAFVDGYVCERKKIETERDRIGLSQWRWPGGRLLRGQWWPWRWGPGYGWCYSFCRARVHPEGSSPGYPPLTAESHSPAGYS